MVATMFFVLRRKKAALIALMVLTSFAIFTFGAKSDAQGDKPVKIRYVSGGSPGQMGFVAYLPYLQQNVLKHYGKKYTVEIFRARGTPEMVAMLTAGEVEISTLAPSTATMVISKKTVPGGISIIADSLLEGHEDGKYFSNTWVALEESGIKTVQDLKGKKVAVNQVGTGVDMSLRRMLIKSGLDPGKDLQIVEIGFPNIPAALREKRIDAGVFLQAFYAREHKKGGLRDIFNTYQAWGATTNVIFTAATNKFLKENTEAAKAYLGDFVRAIKWYQDPKNRAKAIEIVHEATKEPKESLELYYLAKGDKWIDPNGCPRAKYIQPVIDFAVEKGYLKERVDIKKYIDTSYLPNPCPAD